MGVAGLDQACLAAKDLLQILELEFEALKSQDMGEFENLQSRKEPILKLLSDLGVPAVEKGGSNNDPWSPLREIILQCREVHIKNEILINRKLESIRMALNTMTGNSQASQEMYDKLGKISQKQIRKNFLEV